MGRIKKYIISTIAMLITSVIGLLILSVLTYVFKWQSDTAMIGIVVIYILAGFVGGRSLKRGQLRRERNGEVIYQQQQTGIGNKIPESVIAASLFIGVLLILSMILKKEAFEISSQLLMVWLLFAGSASLGRIV